MASAITGASGPDQVAANPQPAEHRLPTTTPAGIDDVLTLVTG